MQHGSSWDALSLNLVLLFVTLFFFEKKIYARFFPNFSPFFVFVVITSTSCLLYAYISPTVSLIYRKNPYATPSELTDNIAYYTKTFAPKSDDKIFVFSTWIAHAFPIIDYLGKENPHKFSTSFILADNAAGRDFSMFKAGDHDKILTLSYLFDSVKEQLKNPQTKVLFINNSLDVLSNHDRCLIGFLEYYFLDPEFKKIFFKNFHFENHLLIAKEVKVPKKNNFISGKKSDIFDQLKPSTKRILYDFEVYVRN